MEPSVGPGSPLLQPHLLVGDARVISKQPVIGRSSRGQAEKQRVLDQPAPVASDTLRVSAASPEAVRSFESLPDLEVAVRKREFSIRLYESNLSAQALMVWSQYADGSGFVAATGDHRDEFDVESGSSTGSYAWFIKSAEWRETEPAVVLEKTPPTELAVTVLRSFPKPRSITEAAVPVSSSVVVARVAPRQPAPEVEYSTSEYPAETAGAARAQPVVPVQESSAATLLADVKSDSGYSAFDLSLVAGATTSVWSYEGWARSSKEGWLVSSAQEQWPTLTYLSTQKQGAEPFKPAFLSQREASVLSALGGNSLQGQAGIVFGQVPAGFIVELSGRAEYPVYWIPEQGSVSSQDFGGQRWFAFTNVEPGMQIASLVNMWTGERVPVAAAVVGGYSTHLNLLELERLTIQVRTLDGARSDWAPRAGIRVSRSGVTGEPVVSDRLGTAVLANQLVVRSYPVYLELQESEAAATPQRIRISGDEAIRSIHEPVSVAYLRGGQINALIAQLEPSVAGAAPIHPSSGMVLAAWNGKGRVARGSTLVPVDYPVDPSSELEPEVYLINSVDQLSVEGGVGHGLSRAMTVQVDAGLHKMTLTDESGQTEVWGELAVVSTGVVTVLRTGYQN